MKVRVEVPALEPHDDAARVAHDRPIIALVAETGREAALAALVGGVEAGGGRVATLRASLRATAGFQLEPGAVFSDASSSSAAIRAALAALPPPDVLVCDGPLAVDLLRPTLAIAVVPSESPALLSRDLRAVRHRIDLFLLEARPALLGRLAERVLAEARAVVVASRA